MWIGKKFPKLNNIICHLSWLKKLFVTHTHPLKTIREFSKPYELLFSDLESLVKCNHKIRGQECYGAELCLAHDMGGGVEAYGGAPFGRHAALRLFHFLVDTTRRVPVVFVSPLSCPCLDLITMNCHLTRSYTQTCDGQGTEPKLPAKLFKYLWKVFLLH